MILIIRGHIRQSFNTPNLFNLINHIYSTNNQLQIYIHTWNKYANNISWRKISANNTKVTKEDIYNYFQHLKHIIKHIIIDDDTQIQLIGRTTGYLNEKLHVPIIGWKNYWYGKYNIIRHIYNHSTNKDQMAINLRFDILNNSNSIKTHDIIDFINKYTNNTFSKNVFLYDREHMGIDNIYIGNINTMYKLINYFLHNLDNILDDAFNNTNNIYVRHQENLVFQINNHIF